jgi:four helix bundle protein
MFNQEEKQEREERPGTFFRFEDLRIYHKSLDYNNWLQEVSTLFPDNDKTQLIQRFNHSARNITLYIAEGSARNKSQFIYYLKMAKSSIRECLVYTSLAHRASHLTDEYEDYSRSQLMEMTKMIGALISSLQRSSNNHNNYGDPQNNGRGRQEENAPYYEHNPNEMYNTDY